MFRRRPAPRVPTAGLLMWVVPARLGLWGRGVPPAEGPCETRGAGGGDGDVQGAVFHLETLLHPLALGGNQGGLAQEVIVPPLIPVPHFKAQGAGEE